jgi:hypothetical protein
MRRSTLPTLGATRLAQFRQSGDPTQKTAAVAALESAAQNWRAYAQLAGSQYRPHVLARGRTLDWHAVTKRVDQEIATVRAATRGSSGHLPLDTVSTKRTSHSAAPGESENNQ